MMTKSELLEQLGWQWVDWKFICRDQTVDFEAMKEMGWDELLKRSTTKTFPLNGDKVTLLQVPVVCDFPAEWEGKARRVWEHE